MLLSVRGMGPGRGGSLVKRCCVVVSAVLVVGLALAAAAPVSALVPDGTQGWFWQMPQPAGDLNDVTFVTATHVFAVGDGGLILASNRRRRHLGGRTERHRRRPDVGGLSGRSARLGLWRHARRRRRSGVILAISPTAAAHLARQGAAGC